MAKATTEKKEFAWDTEIKIGEFGNDKQRHTVNLCTLNGKTYVQDVKEVFTQKNGWKRTKGNTLEMSVFKELQDIVGNHELTSAFEGGTTKQVVEKKPAKGLTAKHQAKDAAPVMQGKKRTDI